MKPIYLIFMRLLLPARISLTDNLAYNIYLWFKLVDCFFGILVPQGLSFLLLAIDELCLARLEVLVIALIHIIMVSN